MQTVVVVMKDGTVWRQGIGPDDDNWFQLTMPVVPIEMTDLEMGAKIERNDFQHMVLVEEAQ